MRMHRLASVATAAALAVSAGLTAAEPAQAATRPGLVLDYASHRTKVKPTTFRPYKDVNFSNVHWTSLNSTTGYATAVLNFNTCLPDCAHANYRHTKVKLQFSKVRLSDCRPVFSQVRSTDVKSKRTTTFSLPVFPKSGC